MLHETKIKSAENNTVKGTSVCRKQHAHNYIVYRFLRLLKGSVPKKYMMQLCYLIIRIMCCVVQSCICLGITDSHIIISRDFFPFLTLAVLVAILYAGMKFCESYVVATVGLYI